MKIKHLIEKLAEYDPECTIEVFEPTQWSLSVPIINLKQLNDNTVIIYIDNSGT